MRSERVVLFVCVVTCALVSATAFTRAQGVADDWREYTGDKRGSRFAPADGVSADSVKNMKVAWRWSMPDNNLAAGNPDLRTWVNESTPLAVNGVLYAVSPMSTVSAIDGSSGTTLWTYDPKAYEDGSPPNLGFLNRGVTYWEDGDDKRIIVGTANAYLIALDAETGMPIASFGDNGRIDLTKGLRRPVLREHVMVTTPAIICAGQIIPSQLILDSFAIGRPPLKEHGVGDLRGFDLKTGKQSWVFHNPPQEGEFGNDTWQGQSWKTAGGMNMWTRATCDDEAGLVYLPLSTPANDFYGGERKGDDLFAESLVALEAKTGKLAWYFQAVHHGLWDYDLPTGPNLMDLNIDGKVVKAAVQVTKQGFLFAFDRLSGKPIWPIEERPVSQSTVPGEQSSPTQPFASKPPPFIQQGASVDDLIDLTPQLKEEAQKILSRYNFGPLFTPPTTDKAGTLVVPGVLGGGSWVGAAHNPDTNALYVPSYMLPFAVRLKKETVAAYAYTGTWAAVGGPRGLPLFKPPFSTITAYDMNKGEILWQVPAGKGPVDNPAIKDLKLGPLGVPRMSHIVLTRDILFAAPDGTYSMLGLSNRGNAIIAQATADEAEPYLYAYDAKTGALVSELKLPGAAFGSLMTYAAQGKRYVVVPIGGAGLPAELVAVQVN